MIQETQNTMNDIVSAGERNERTRSGFRIESGMTPGLSTENYLIGSGNGVKFLLPGRFYGKRPSIRRDGCQTNC